MEWNVALELWLSCLRMWRRLTPRCNSQLGQAHLSRLSVRVVGARLTSLSASPTDCLKNTANGQATVDPKLPLLVDDAQDAVLRTRSKVQLKLALERRVRTGRPAMLAFTSDKLTRQHLSFLPNVREWALHEIATPKADERVFVVEQMAKFEGLQISRYIARVLASRMRGNGNTLHGAINRLRTYGRSWITPSEVLEACGILDPFFADNPDWDLKEKIQQACNRIAYESMS